MDRLFIQAQVASWVVADTVKTKVKHFLTEEKGGGEIVGAIVLIAIVVLLAVAFKEQLGTLMSNIWSSISGQESAITDSMDLSGGGGTP